jgi:hypothetical protein
MPKEINWEKQAKRDFDPVQIWNDAMYKNKEAVISQAPLHPSVRVRTLLAKNPNYFRDISLKGAQKRREMLKEEVCNQK